MIISKEHPVGGKNGQERVAATPLSDGLDEAYLSLPDEPSSIQRALGSSMTRLKVREEIDAQSEHFGSISRLDAVSFRLPSISSDDGKVLSSDRQDLQMSTGSIGSPQR
jgi:hypothetical protein